MQPCSREIQTTINSILNPSLQDLQNSHFNPSSTTAATTTNDDFFDQVLSNLPSCSWTDLSSTSTNHLDLPGDGIHQFDDSALLASRLRQHQIGGGDSSGTAAAASAKAMLLQQQLLMARTVGLINGGDFERSLEGGDGRIQSMYNGFGAGSMNGSGHPSNLASHFQHIQNFTAQPAGMNQTPAASESTGGGTAPAQPKQRVRARRGQATDPHSIAERLRRERIAERMKALQELVPNANKTDKASMLDEIIDYVKFLQLQVKVLSMSRLGSAAAVAPPVGDLSSEASGGNGRQGGSKSHNNNGNQATSSNDNLTVTEHQVAKLMEEDMGSAMQYLQGKGLCLMPISLATAISTATCQVRNPMMNNHLASNGEGPSSPNLSVLTVQSATLGNSTLDGSAKDAASVCKP